MWFNITEKEQQSIFLLRLKLFNDKVAMWNQMISLIKGNYIKKKKVTLFLFLLCCVTVILRWQVISTLFMPHCVLIVLFVCTLSKQRSVFRNKLNFLCLTAQQWEAHSPAKVSVITTLHKKHSKCRKRFTEYNSKLAFGSRGYIYFCRKYIPSAHHAVKVVLAFHQLTKSSVCGK